MSIVGSRKSEVRKVRKSEARKKDALGHASFGLPVFSVFQTYSHRLNTSVLLVLNCINRTLLALL